MAHGLIIREDVRKARGAPKRHKKQDKLSAIKKFPPNVDLRLPSIGEIEAVCRTQIPHFDPWCHCDGMTFDAVKAIAAIRWFHEHIRHVVGEFAGTPFYLNSKQQAFVGNLFGWVDERGRRRFQRFYYSEGRSNGKSTLASGLALKMVLDPAEYEAGAEIYSFATDVAQATIKVWRPARMMVECSEYLLSRAKLWAKSIQSASDLLTSYQAIPLDKRGVHGIHCHAGLVDELHTQTEAEPLETLITGTIGRPNGFVGTFTTAGWDRHSPCYAWYEEAKLVMSGKLKDLTYLPCISEPDEGDDWTQEGTWRKANPNLGTAISLERMRTACERAQRKPHLENKFKRDHLNMWTQQSIRWLRVSDWDACGKPAPWALSLEQLRKRRCHGGLDLAETRDLSAFALCFRLDDRRYQWLVHCFMPEATADERQKSDRVPYREWAERGCVTLTPGNTTDHAFIRKHIVEAAELYDLQRIGFDPRKGGTQLATELTEAHGIETVKIAQGALGMSEPAKLLESLILERNIWHFDDPMLRSHIENIAVKVKDDDSYYVHKPSEVLRVDGVVAGIMALKLASLDVSSKFVYETRGLRVIG